MDNINAKEVGVSTLKSLFGAVPYVGQVFNEVLFDYRSRVKQNRLNSFTELLSDFFKADREIDLDALKSEDFLDLFESVIGGVLQTKSIEKHRRFRDVLANQIVNPNRSYENSGTYLDLITSMGEMEIHILNHHCVFDEELYLRAANVSGAMVESYNKEVAELNKRRKADFYGITTGEFLFYKQTLSNRALMLDRGIGGIDTKPYELMGITEFGKNFLKFIISPG
jgi:hypothetical protein